MKRGRKRSGTYKTCLSCGEVFYDRPSSKRKTCSYSCRGAHQKNTGEFYKRWPELGREGLCDKIDELENVIANHRHFFGILCDYEYVSYETFQEFKSLARGFL